MPPYLIIDDIYLPLSLLYSISAEKKKQYLRLAQEFSNQLGSGLSLNIQFILKRFIC